MDDVRRQLGRAIEDAGYVAVGLALLGAQRAQVRRRELADAVGRVGDWFAAARASTAAAPRDGGGDAPGGDERAGEAGGAGEGGGATR